VAEDVRAGRLVRLLAGYDAYPGTTSGIINVLYPPSLRESSRIRVFVAFLEALMAAQ